MKQQTFNVGDEVVVTKHTYGSHEVGETGVVVPSDQDGRTHVQFSDEASGRGAPFGWYYSADGYDGEIELVKDAVLDAELAVIAQVVAALGTVDRNAAKRIIKYAASRLNLD